MKLMQLNCGMTVQQKRMNGMGIDVRPEEGEWVWTTNKQFQRNDEPNDVSRGGWNTSLEYIFRF